MLNRCKLIETAVLTLLIILSFFTFNCEKKSNEQIDIGVIADLSGNLSVYGQWNKRGIDVAYEKLNNKSNYNLIIEDSRSDTKTAVSAIQKLINVDKVKIIIAANASSSHIMAMSPISEKNKTILFVTTASSPSIADAGNYIFRNRLSGDKEIEAVVFYAKENGIDNISFVTLNNEAGQSYAKFFQNSADTNKITVPLKSWINLEERNMQIHSTKLKSINTPAVFYAGPINIGASLLKSCAEIGYSPQWFSISAMRSDELFELAGNASENLILATEYPDTSSQKYKNFSVIYKNKYNEQPNIFSVNSYDALNFIASAVNSVGYNPEKIKEFFYSKKFSGAGGEIEFDVKGDPLRKIYLIKVLNQKFVLLSN